MAGEAIIYSLHRDHICDINTKNTGFVAICITITTYYNLEHMMYYWYYSIQVFLTSWR